MEEDKRNIINLETGKVVLHPDLILQI
jgi:hypothetical protein